MQQFQQILQRAIAERAKSVIISANSSPLGALVQGEADWVDFGNTEATYIESLFQTLFPGGVELKPEQGQIDVPNYGRLLTIAVPGPIPRLYVFLPSGHADFQSVWIEVANAYAETLETAMPENPFESTLSRVTGQMPSPAQLATNGQAPAQPNAHRPSDVPPPPPPPPPSPSPPHNASNGEDKIENEFEETTSFGSVMAESPVPRAPAYAAAPDMDISAPPAMDVSAPPKMDISAPPKFNVSAPPNMDVSTPPNMDVSAPPNMDVSAPPNMDVNAPAAARTAPAPAAKDNRSSSAADITAPPAVDISAAPNMATSPAPATNKQPAKVEQLGDEAQPQKPEAVPVPKPFVPSQKLSTSIEEGPKEIDEMLKFMLEKKASDIHVTCGEPIALRIDGEMVRFDRWVIDGESFARLFNPITSEHNQHEYFETYDTDFAYEIPGVARFRVNLFKDRLGPCAVLRQIANKILTFEDLGLPEQLRKLCYLNKGLVVVTGPTGSGKSTTLAALVDHMNDVRRDHILTLEDPIEFVHPQKNCLIRQREIHKHTKSFARALKAALREDPDIILVGELRDLETTALAIEIAETGHLVMGTLHTTTAVSTIDRIIDQFPSEQQEQIRTMLSESLKGVVAQTLMRRIGGGRCAAQEILMVDSAVSSLIREGKSHMIANQMQSQKAAGNVLLNDALTKAVIRGLVEPKEAWMKSVQKNELLNRYMSAGVDMRWYEQFTQDEDEQQKNKAAS